VTSAARMSVDLDAIRRIAATARDERRLTLLEPEARDVLTAIRIAVPEAVFVPLIDGVPDDVALHQAVGPGHGADGRVVVRVVAPDIAHKTEVGGVAVVPRDRTVVLDAMSGMLARLRDRRVVGFVVAAYVDHDASLGSALLVSARWIGDVGPVVTVGAGGIDAEAVAADLRPGRDVVMLSPSLTASDDIASLLRASTAVRLATEPMRGQPPRVAMAALVAVVERLLELAAVCMPGDLTSLEVNPLVISGGAFVALDVLAEVGTGAPTPDPSAARPTALLARMLEPRSVALIGVSSGMNAGHVILRNLLRDGFDAGHITVVKPGAETIDGCSCVPDVASLPEQVDLFVVAVSAAQAAEVVADVIERDAARTILVIPGGFEEKQGSEAIVARMRAALEASRSRPDGGPLLNGGNCLGFRSVPGRIDTMFIPASKLPGVAGSAAPLAIIAQSGAFAITRLGRIPDLHPRYLITIGNQMDLTVGDHLDYLANDPSIRVFGVYVEGFRPLDARRLLAAAKRIREGGGTVVLYRAGRTSAGAAASASHTASIAGDVTVTRALAEQAGVLEADTLESFDDLVRTATLLVDRTVAGRRLGALSNAGFECVAIGDNLGSLELGRFDVATSSRLGSILERSGAGGVVDVHNPLDATPMADDAAFADLAEAVLADPGVDVGVVGIVPLTAALQTLPPGPGHDEDLAIPDGVAARLIDLWGRTSLAWVAIVDGGPLYDPFVAMLEAAGIPVFRTADRAMRALDAVVRHRLP
jgi:acyl-CoA synthetase (NDP forming)